MRKAFIIFVLALGLCFFISLCVLVVYPELIRFEFVGIGAYVIMFLLVILFIVEYFRDEQGTKK